MKRRRTRRRDWKLKIAVWSGVVSEVIGNGASTRDQRARDLVGRPFQILQEFQNMPHMAV